MLEIETKDNGYYLEIIWIRNENLVLFQGKKSYFVNISNQKVLVERAAHLWRQIF